MSATTFRTKTSFAGELPARVTLPSAANKLFVGRTLVQRDASGRATPGADGNGFPAVGVANATYDNRTGSENGGAAGAIDIEATCGVFGFDYEGTPRSGQTVWVVDNETVSDDSDTGARGVAGVCVDIREGQCFVLVSPIAAGLFSDDSAVEAAVTTAQADIDALQADALSAHALLPIPILSALVASTGLAVAAAAPSTSVPGTVIADSKSAVVKWLPHATPGAIALDVAMPADLDDAADVIFYALVSKSGATVGDATKITLAAFEVVPGALHDADTDLGGDTGAVVGDATAKTVTALSRTLALADIHAYPEGLTLTIKPKSGTLGTDSFYLHAAWLEYTRKLRTS